MLLVMVVVVVKARLFCAEKMPSNFHSNYLFNSLELIETKMRSIHVVTF